MILQRWLIEVKGPDLDQDLTEEVLLEALNRALGELEFEGRLDPGCTIQSVDLEDEYHVTGVMR